MIVDQFRTDATDDRIERSARVRTAGRELRLAFDHPVLPGTVPSTRVDGTPMVVATVLAAMMAGEDVVVDAPVSPLVADRLDEVVTAYARWDPTLRPPRITTAGALEPGPPGPGVGCFFSRGADSMVSAALARRSPAPLTHLVFVDGLEPRHSRPTADEEIALAARAATRLDLPLCVVRTNVRALTNDWRDWADVHGAALAAIALGFDGVFGAVVIPSTQAVNELAPYGSSPVLDPLFSSESVRVHHDDLSLDRAGKIAFLTAQRPDLLPLLKVCYAEDRPDNCGRCGKCLLTMCSLVAADALPLATGFPDRVPMDALRALRPSPLHSRQHWVAVCRALGAEGVAGELRRTIERSLRRAARPGPAARVALVRDRAIGRRPTANPTWRAPERGFDWRNTSELLRLLTEGRPDRPLQPWAEPPLVRQRARPAPSTVEP